MQTTEVIAEHDRWRELSKSVREKLVAERNELTARLSEVNRRLSEMGAPEASNHKPETGAFSAIKTPTLERVSPTDSMTEVVRKLLKASDKPMMAAEIIDQVSKVRAVDRRATIHSILFQLKDKKKLIDARQHNGKLEFFWKGEPE